MPCCARALSSSSATTAGIVIAVLATLAVFIAVLVLLLKRRPTNSDAAAAVDPTVYSITNPSRRPPGLGGGREPPATPVRTSTVGNPAFDDYLAPDQDQPDKYAAAKQQREGEGDAGPDYAQPDEGQPDPVYGEAEAETGGHGGPGEVHGGAGTLHIGAGEIAAATVALAAEAEAAGGHSAGNHTRGGGGALAAVAATKPGRGRNKGGGGIVRGERKGSILLGFGDDGGADQGQSAV